MTLEVKSKCDFCHTQVVEQGTVEGIQSGIQKTMTSLGKTVYMNKILAVNLEIHGFNFNKQATLKFDICDDCKVKMLKAAEESIIEFDTVLRNILKKVNKMTDTTRLLTKFDAIQFEEKPEEEEIPF